MSYTEPLYAAPIILDGDETISVTFLAGATPYTTAAMTAGTYYNSILADAGGLSALAAEIVSVLNTAETGAGNTATWSASTPPSGWGFRIKLTRVGQAADDVNTITFPAGFGTGYLGLTVDAPVYTGTEITNDDGAAGTTTLTATYQRGYVWLPREQLTRVEEWGEGTSAVAKTNDGSAAVVDGYGDHRIVQHTIDFVRAAMVYDFAVADVQSLGYRDCFTGLQSGDPNVTFEGFWRHLTQNRGAAPVVQYYQDSGTLSAPEAITFANGDWLTSCAPGSTSVEELNESAAMYRVRMRGHAVV